MLVDRKVWKAAESFVYFLLFKLNLSAKRSGIPPQPIYSEIPSKALRKESPYLMKARRLGRPSGDFFEWNRAAAV